MGAAKSRKKEYSIFRITFFGEAGVGKAEIISHFNDSCEKQLTTVGFEKSAKKIRIFHEDKAKELGVVLFDNIGQERFRTIASSTITCSDGFIIVFSVIDKLSFEKISFWIEQIREVSYDIPMAIIGNHCELTEQRVISAEQGRELAQQLGGNTAYFDVSAKTGMGINEAINWTVSKAYSNYKLSKNKKK